MNEPARAPDLPDNVPANAVMESMMDTFMIEFAEQLDVKLLSINFVAAFIDADNKADFLNGVWDQSLNQDT